MIVVMYVVRVPNRGSPPAILLRESYREDGKVKNRTLANLSSWPEAKVDALARVLKGQPPPAADLDGAFEITRSLPHGHVAAVLGTARALGLDCGPMSGFDQQKVNAEFFPDGKWKANFLCNVGYGDPSKLFPRNPRLKFEEACLVL